MVDTRSGLWLALLTALSAVAAVIADVATGNATRTLGETFVDAMLASSILLPIIPILLMTSEWTQRTALSTFALVPIRERVVAAKLGATLALLGTIVLLSATLAAIGTALDGGSFTISFDDAGRIVVYEFLVLMFGFGLAAILMNSPAAIVLNFVAPIIVTGIGAISGAVNDAIAWIDPGAWDALTDSTTDQWDKIATASIVWVVVPIALGVVRLRRRDIS